MARRSVRVDGDAERMAAIGVAINRKRTLCCVSMATLCKKARVSKSVLNRVENGETDPGIMGLLRVAAVLHMSAEDMFGEAMAVPVPPPATVE